MKARVKATGEIVDVIAISDYINEFGQIIGEYKDANGRLYTSYELDFYIEEGIPIPDYWTRLEHQAAIAAMQGMVADADNLLRIKLDGVEEQEVCEIIRAQTEAVAEIANLFAHALVEKYKKEEK